MDDEKIGVIPVTQFGWLCIYCCRFSYEIIHSKLKNGSGWSLTPHFLYFFQMIWLFEDDQCSSRTALCGRKFWLPRVMSEGESWCIDGAVTSAYCTMDAFGYKKVSSWAWYKIKLFTYSDSCWRVRGNRKPPPASPSSKDLRWLSWRSS